MKMRYFLIATAIFLQISLVNGQDASWEIVPGKITSTWAEEVDPENVLPEYPRPQMVRENWQNLNGLWNYTLVAKSQEENIPTQFQGLILVPFAIESALSGVGKRVGKDSVLWYKTTVKVPS